MTDVMKSRPEKQQPQPRWSATPLRRRYALAAGTGRTRSSARVEIVAGVMFIVALVFFSGFFIGRNSYDNFRGGYHQPGMMGPSQTGPYGQMWPGMMGPGGMMGPYGPWPGQQPPTTTAPTTPRP